MFSFEVRYSLHRQKANESYEIAEHGHPVRSYMDIDEIVRVALLAGADAVYPGYGFLSEDPRLAAACLEHGLTFVGPPSDVLEPVGNKVRALAAARAAGLPTLATASLPPSAAQDYDLGGGALRDQSSLVDMASEIGFPHFVEAAADGDGRGLRLVGAMSELGASIRSAASEAASSFDDDTVFLEQAVIRRRHIEVQVRADAGATASTSTNVIVRFSGATRR